VVDQTFTVPQMFIGNESGSRVYIAAIDTTSQKTALLWTQSLLSSSASKTLQQHDDPVGTLCCRGGFARRLWSGPDTLDWTAREGSSAWTSYAAATWEYPSGMPVAASPSTHLGDRADRC
jgi:hypothetical protein